MKYQWDPPKRLLPHEVDPWLSCPSCEGQEGKECPICLGTGGWYTSDGDFEAFRRKTVREVARGGGASCPCLGHSTTEQEGKS